MAKVTKIDNVATWEMIGKDANATKIAEALEKVGLNFDVEKRAIYFNDSVGAMKKIPESMATVRTDSETHLGIVGKGYQICQNADAFAFADFIDKDIKFTRGGMTYSGLCWVMAEMPTIKILGEEYVPCLCLQNSFNGKYQVRANIVALNHANGSQVALELNGISNTIKVKHSTNLVSRMKQGQEALASVSAYMDGLRKIAQKYADIKMDKEQIEMFLSILFPIRKDMSENTKVNVDAQRKMFLACYDDVGNKTNYGTAWGIIKAYADYITHTIGKDTKTKYERKFMETTLGKNRFGSFLKKLETVTGQKVA